MAPLLGTKRMVTFETASWVARLRAVPSKTHFSEDVSCAINDPRGMKNATRPMAQADHNVTVTYHLPGSDFRISMELLRVEVGIAGGVPDWEPAITDAAPRSNRW